MSERFSVHRERYRAFHQLFTADAQSDRQTIAPVRRSLREALQKIIPQRAFAPIYFPDRGSKAEPEARSPLSLPGIDVDKLFRLACDTSDQSLKGAYMKSLIAQLAIGAVVSLFAASSFAQQQRKYEVDPKTKWAVGAKQTPADELKKQVDAGAVMIIDVRPPANFEKETIPGAINVPLEQLEGYLKKISTQTYIVFT
jgi:Rhodanese-like domain